MRAAACPAALECGTETQKKREPNNSAPQIEGCGLEVKFRNQLHYARIVGEGLCRISESTVPSPNELSDAGVPNRVNGINTARNELGVVEYVEGLSGELNACSFSSLKGFYHSHVPVVRARGRSRVTSSGRQCTVCSLNVLRIGVNRNVTNDVCRGAT
jgi:hypothetical protein